MNENYFDEVKWPDLQSQMEYYTIICEQSMLEQKLKGVCNKEVWEIYADLCRLTDRKEALLRRTYYLHGSDGHGQLLQ